MKTHIDDIDLDNYDDVNSQFDLHGQMDSGIDTCNHCKEDIIDSTGEDDRRYHLLDCKSIDHTNPQIVYCLREGCRIDTRESKEYEDGTWACEICGDEI